MVARHDFNEMNWGRLGFSFGGTAGFQGAFGGWSLGIVRETRCERAPLVNPPT